MKDETRKVIGFIPYNNQNQRGFSYLIQIEEVSGFVDGIKCYRIEEKLLYEYHSYEPCMTGGDRMLFRAYVAIYSGLVAMMTRGTLQSMKDAEYKHRREIHFDEY